MHLFLISLCLSLLLCYVQATLDMGVCSLSCSGDENTPLQSNHPVSRLAAQGPPGRRGPSGPIGPSGPQGPPGAPGKGILGSYGSVYNPGISCRDIYNHDVVTDGVYFIHTEPQSSTFQVYCDMTSPGSHGWTLVASVHENNVHGKCTIGDKWSSEEGNVSDTNSGSNSWTDTVVFGNVESATSADYKNPAFFLLQATNLMIWHVPNGTPLTRYKADSQVIYETNNDFLSQNGSNLRGLFRNYYPLNKHSRRIENDVKSMMSLVSRNAGSIKNTISSFFQYNYDITRDQVTYISDGGNDLFDSGNKIQFAVNEGNLSEQLVYNQTYTETDGVEIKTWAGHPFIALAYITDFNAVRSFKLKVSSNMGADGSGSVTTYSGSSNRGDFNVVYRANHVYGASDPSCAQVFFVISSQADASQTTVTTPEWENSDTQNLIDSFMVSFSRSRNRAAIVGYMLLTRTSGSQISSSQIQSAVNVLTDRFVGNLVLDELTQPCSHERNSLAVPINFLKGNQDSIIPRIHSGLFESGFMHFRPYDNYGIPRAICPGVRSTSCFPHRMCVGGINTYKYEQVSQCGDFISDTSTSMLIFYD